MTTTEKPKLTATELVDTLTGFDEIAIEQAFGDDVSRLARASVGKFSRALAFVLARRDGMGDAEAKKHVMGLTRGQIDELFAEEEDAELPGSEAGKGDA